MSEGWVRIECGLNEDWEDLRAIRWSGVAELHTRKREKREAKTYKREGNVSENVREA